MHAACPHLKDLDICFEPFAPRGVLNGELLEGDKSEVPRAMECLSRQQSGTAKISAINVNTMAAPDT